MVITVGKSLKCIWNIRAVFVQFTEFTRAFPQSFIKSYINPKKYKFSLYLAVRDLKTNYYH